MQGSSGWCKSFSRGSGLCLMNTHNIKTLTVTQRRAGTGAQSGRQGGTACRRSGRAARPYHVTGTTSSALITAEITSGDGQPNTEVPDSCLSRTDPRPSVKEGTPTLGSWGRCLGYQLTTEGSSGRDGVVFFLF